MLGLDGAKGWRTWRIYQAMQRLAVTRSPRHRETNAQGCCLTAWLVTDSHDIVAMPISNATLRVVDIYGNILCVSSPKYSNQVSAMSKCG